MKFLVLISAVFLISVVYGVTVDEEWANFKVIFVNFMRFLFLSFNCVISRQNSTEIMRVPMRKQDDLRFLRPLSIRLKSTMRKQTAPSRKASINFLIRHLKKEAGDSE